MCMYETLQGFLQTFPYHQDYRGGKRGENFETIKIILLSES